MGAMTGDRRSITFNNQTDRTWTMAIYQTLPKSTNLDSVSWQQVTVAESGVNSISWANTFNAVIASYTDSEGKQLYKAFQLPAASPGSAWKIVMKGGILQLQADGSAPLSTQIQIANVSGQLANPGLGMDGKGAVYQQGLFSGLSVLFETSPLLWVGLFDLISPGEVITGGLNRKVSFMTTMAGPWALKYPAGQNGATLKAWIENSSLQTSLEYTGAAR